MVKGSVSTSRLEGSMVHDIDDETFEVKAVRV
jgi:hypothetical protein